MALRPSACIGSTVDSNAHRTPDAKLLPGAAAVRGIGGRGPSAHAGHLTAATRLPRPSIDCHCQTPGPPRGHVELQRRRATQSSRLREVGYAVEQDLAKRRNRHHLAVRREFEQAGGTMNALVDLRPSTKGSRIVAPVPAPAHGKLSLHRKRRSQAALPRYWRFRTTGQPLCELDVPDVHAIVFVSPERIALEAALRNESGLARYDAARHARRIEKMRADFEACVPSMADHVDGQARVAATRAPRTVVEVGIARTGKRNALRRVAA